MKAIHRSVFGLLIVAASIAGAQSDSAPLGDVARSQSKPTKKAVRVLTDDDFVQRAPAPPPEAPPDPAAATAETAAKTAKLASPGTQTTAPVTGATVPVASELKRLDEVANEQDRMILKLEQALHEDGIGDEQKQEMMRSLDQARKLLDAYRQQRALLESAAKLPAAPPATAGETKKD